MTDLQIAIDGPAASGKSTVAKLVAARLGAWYISTGELYRALTLEALHRGILPSENPDAVVGFLPDADLIYAPPPSGRDVVLQLNGSPVPAADLRTAAVSAQVSYVARIPEVRKWLVERQRETRHLGSVVVEGRDIGTVVFPATPHKFFITASPRERARRRLAQAGETAPGATLDSVAADIARRDELDSKRAVAPLKPAEDAEQIVTDTLPPEQVANQIVESVRSRSDGQ